MPSGSGMRIRVDLLIEPALVLPWHYLDWLRGVVYQALWRGAPRVATRLHDEGWVLGSRQYKPLTYSLLQAARARATPGGLLVEGRTGWWISSPLVGVMEAVVTGLVSEGQVRLGERLVPVMGVEVVPPPVWAERMVFTTLSPLCVSTAESDGQGGLRKRYLQPTEADFSRVLSENLRRKAAAFLGRSVEGEVVVRWQGRPQSRLLLVSGMQVRGWQGTFVAEGPVELLQIGYNAGFGERTAQGFGMVAAAEAMANGERGKRDSRRAE